MKTIDDLNKLDETFDLFKACRLEVLRTVELEPIFRDTKTKECFRMTREFNFAFFDKLDKYWKEKRTNASKNR